MRRMASSGHRPLPPARSQDVNAHDVPPGPGIVSWPGTQTGRLLAVILALLTGSAAGCLDGPPEETPPPADPDGELVGFYAALATGREVRFETSHGPIRLLLYDALMPRTSARFGELVADGFYDDTPIHRVVERFVIQGGDPSGTGLLGSGETVRHERHDALRFGQGAVGLARDLDPDSGDSQWFITLTPQPHLSDPDSESAQTWGTFALYAQVLDGIAVARAIGQTLTIPGLDRPVAEVTLEAARLLAPPQDADLLALPPTLHPRDRLGAHDFDLQRPLHVFAGHAFPVAVALRPDDPDAEPPERVVVRFEARVATASGGTRVESEQATLEPAAGDRWSFEGRARLPRAGSWDVIAEAGAAASAAHALVVEPWHDDYAAFTGTR